MERLRHRLQTRRYSSRTEAVYCGWVCQFVIFHDRRDPATMGETQIAEFLTHLATVRKQSNTAQRRVASRA